MRTAARRSGLCLAMGREAGVHALLMARRTAGAPASARAAAAAPLRSALGALAEAGRALARQRLVA